MARAILKKTRESRVRSGHPWVFLSDVERVEGAFEPGDVVEVFSSRGALQGKAFYNPQSQIALRMLTRLDEEIGADFFRRRVHQAIAYRRRFADMDSCRLIFAESDFLPALIVDKFHDVLVVQTLCLGIDRWKDVLIDILDQALSPRGIYERNDAPVRRLEGMDQRAGLVRGSVPERVEIAENGVRYLVDVAGGQKTGFFLDQKENRAAIEKLCPGARVLDCFCHNGSFALNAARFGAAEVLGVDISEEALFVARQNALLNGLSNVRFEAHNCFDLLRALSAKKEQYDLVILDPPAFTKTRSALEGALRGYKEINLRGLKLTRPGGFLVTCSCSQHVSQQAFTDMINQAARDARKRLRLVEMRGQAHDHPVLPASPETHYLKCAILQVMD
jgi:23S rRNA (cytosine1962-C5)-methyltransferase